MKNLKKGVIAVLAVLVMAVFLAGCINYKPYQPTKGDNASEADLLNQIAEIEKEMGTNGTTAKATTTEPVTTTETNKTPVAEETQEVKIPLGEKVDRSQLQKIEVKENDLVSLNLKVSDPNSDQVSYSFSAPLNEQGKWKTNYGDAGEYVVTITATDGKLTTKKDILLVVKKVNVPPIIKEIKDMTVKENETVSLKPEVVDPNGDSVTVTISPPLETGTWAADFASSGVYKIAVNATDGELLSAKTFQLTVLDVNRPPQISDLSDMTVKEGDKVVIAPNVTDPDKGDKVTSTISAPVGNTGVWQTDYISHGDYQITVTATDGKVNVSKTITLTVQPVNMPPVITDIKLG